MTIPTIFLCNGINIKYVPSNQLSLVCNEDMTRSHWLCSLSTPRTQPFICKDLDFALNIEQTLMHKIFFKHRFACTLNMNIVRPSSLKTCTVLTHFQYFRAALSTPQPSLCGQYNMEGENGDIIIWAVSVSPLFPWPSIEWRLREWGTEATSSLLDPSLVT